MDQDPELLRRYAEASSEEAFTELVRRYIDLVYGVALRYTGNPQRAEDAAQAVFINLARKAGTLSRRQELAGWLYVAARYSAANIVRKDVRRQKYEREAELMREVTSDPNPPGDWAKAGPALDDALADLGERDRTAVLLRYFRGQSFGEVGAAMGTTEDAARKRVDRGLERLRKILAKQGISSTSTAILALLEGEAATAAPAGLASSVTGAALAKAVAAAGKSALGLVQFMSTTKLAMGGAVVAGLLAIGFTIRESEGHRADAAAYLRAEKEHQASMAQIQELERNVKAARQEVADLSAAVAAARVKIEHASKAGTAAPRALSSAEKEVKGLQAMKGVNWKLSGDPQVRALFRTAQTAAANSVFAQYFAAMGWSSSKIAAFDELWLDSEIHVDQAILTLRPESESREQADQDLQRFLGSDWAQFVQYWQGSYVRSVATGLAGNLYATDAPLNVAQADQLTAILVANSQSSSTNGFPFPGQVNWGPAVSQAQNVLSPAQYQVFRNEVAIISSQPGLWAGVSFIPGIIGASAGPPSSVLAVSKSGP